MYLLKMGMLEGNIIISKKLSFNKKLNMNFDLCRLGTTIYNYIENDEIKRFC